jgi:hypothetical protein
MVNNGDGPGEQPNYELSKRWRSVDWDAVLKQDTTAVRPCACLPFLTLRMSAGVVAAACESVHAHLLPCSLGIPSVCGRSAPFVGSSLPPLTPAQSCQPQDHLFMRSGLIRKDKVMQHVSPDAHPRSYVVRSADDIRAAIAKDFTLGEGEAEGEGEATTTTTTWVLKLSDSSNAHGLGFLQSASGRVTLGASETELEERWTTHPDRRHVLQRYVEPLLLDGRKFHIRALVLAVGVLDVFLYQVTGLGLGSSRIVDSNEDHIQRRGQRQSRPGHS